MDALRGICAIAVMIMHSEFLTGINLAPSAYLSVDLFFLMSGFVIGSAYDDRLRQGGFALAFLKRRVARLSPMWAIGLSIGAVAPILFARKTGFAGGVVADYLVGLMLVPSLAAGYLFPFNPPGWSLMFEAVANIGYALSARRLGWGMLATIIVIAGVGVGSASFSHGDLFGGQQTWTFHVGLARVSFSFFLGLAVYRAPRPRLLAGSLPFLLATTAFTLALFVAPGARLRPAYDCAVVLIACPALFLIAISTDLPRSWASAGLGALSYPLYATHFAAMLLTFSIFGLLSHWSGSFLSVPAAFCLMAVLLAVAYWLGRRIDPASQRLVAAIFGQRPVRLPLPENDR